MANGDVISIIVDLPGMFLATIQLWEKFVQTKFSARISRVIARKIIRIRQARRTDMPAITKLLRKFPRHVWMGDIPKPSEFFVALEGERIVGCGALDIYSKKIAEVRSLVVHPDFQGRGIASALVKKCLAKARAKNVRQVLAITGAVRLFEKEGFGSFHEEKYALLKMLR